MKEKSIKKNYLYNICYQILLLITPLITTPYLSRVLGADGIGTYSYVESIVSYFTLFAVIGITTYGQREISYVQDKREKRSKVFWNTKSLEVITSLASLFFYIVFSLKQNNSIMFLVLSFNILAVTADVTWFFQGIEEFGIIVRCNILFKIINIMYIFAFVRKKEDLLLYLFGSAFFLFASNISLWGHISKYVDKPRIREIRPLSNIKIVFSLFIPTVAIQIYTVLDKTMIGVITGNSFENGYYEQAIKISKILLTVLTALGTVMIPRIGYHFERGEADVVVKYIYRAYQFVWFAGIPLCFGLIAISNNFVGWFYGTGYEKVVPLLQILSFLILAIGINNVTGMQYLIPTKREHIFTQTVVIGACVNFIFNIILIPKYQALGAAIASVVAETVITITQIIIVRNELSFLTIISLCRNYFFAGGGMFFMLNYMGKVMESSFVNTLIMVLAGMGIYFALLSIIKDKFWLSNANKVLDILKR